LKLTHLFGAEANLWLGLAMKIAACGGIFEFSDNKTSLEDI